MSHKKKKKKKKHDDTIKSTITPKHKISNLLPIYTPPFCDELPKSNHSSSKGGGLGDWRRLFKSALKDRSSSNMSTKS